jgi:hypothetical protein
LRETKPQQTAGRNPSALDQVSSAPSCPIHAVRLTLLGLAGNRCVHSHQYRDSVGGHLHGDRWPLRAAGTSAKIARHAAAASIAANAGGMLRLWDLSSRGRRLGVPSLRGKRSAARRVPPDSRRRTPNGARLDSRHANREPRMNLRACWTISGG